MGLQGRAEDIVRSQLLSNEPVKLLGAGTSYSWLVRLIWTLGVSSRCSRCRAVPFRSHVTVGSCAQMSCAVCVMYGRSLEYFWSGGDIHQAGCAVLMLLWKPHNRAIEK